MTQVEMTLAVALLVSLVLHVIGVRLYVGIVRQQTETLRELGSTIRHATAAIRSGFKSVRREIRRSEGLTAQKRQDMLRLMESSEERCTDMLRDLMHALQIQGFRISGVTIQNSTGGGAANQAGDNQNEQR